MIGLLQRVCEARVEVGSQVIAQIGPGLLVLVGVERGDAKAQAERLLERLVSYRVFGDSQGKMNLSLRDSGGGLLLVPQFTLAADTTKGLRPGFSTAADPSCGRALFEHLVLAAGRTHHATCSGRFGAHMKVHSVNDGPVTFTLRVAPVPE